MNESLKTALLTADAVRSHESAQNWVEESLRQLIPFDALVIARGNFATDDIWINVIGDLKDAAQPFGIHGFLEMAVPGVYRRWRNYRRTSTIVPPALSAKFQMAYLSSHKPPYDVLVHGVIDPRQKSETCFMLFSKNYTSPAEHKSRMILLTPTLFSLVTRFADWPMRPLNEPKPDESAQKRDLKVSTPVTDFPEKISAHYGLTERELEVMHWVCLGKTNDEIGVILTLSPHTVKNHMQRIFSRLSVRNRAQALKKLESLRDTTAPIRDV